MNGPWSEEEYEPYSGLDPVEAVYRCVECKRVHFHNGAGVGDNGPCCGPKFDLVSWCSGSVVVIKDPPQEVLMAAFKLGGELAVVELLYSGCKACIAWHLYGNGRGLCSVHK